MKNIKRKRLVEALLLFLVVGFLMFFSPSVGKAQNNSTGCEYHWVWKWVWVWENEYNGATGRYELQYVYRYRYVYDCVPTVTQPNPTISSNRNSSHLNTVRNADGTLRPANGYHWVNSKDPNDFRVELMPGLIEPEAGRLQPASGYQWINPNDPKDFRVELMPGLIKTEDGFRPDEGYHWINPEDPKDFRVERIP